MSTLADAIHGTLTPQLFSSLAARIGVSETTARTAIGASMRAIVDGLAGKAGDPRAMRDLVALIHQAPDIADPPGLADGDAAFRQSSSKLFGFVPDKTPSLTKWLASSLGLGAVTASRLLTAAAGLVLRGFRTLSRSRGGLDASSLSAALIAAPAGLYEAMPRAKSHERIDVPAPHDVRVVPDEAPPAHDRGRRRRWHVLLALVLMLLLGVWLFDRVRDRRDVLPVSASATQGPSCEAPPRDGDACDPVVMPPTHEEPVGQTRPIEPAQPRVVLDLPAASAEAELLAHIMAPVRVDPDTWFILDSVTFATGSSEIPSEANAQISRVAQVLERNPDVKLELAGHADGPGSTQVNQRLSLARAQRARHALIEKGIDGTRIEARGDGEIRSLEQTRSESQRYSGVAVRVIAR